MNELTDRPLRVQDEIILLHWWRLIRWFANLRLVPRWREESARLFLRAIRRYFYDGLTRVGKIVLICCILIFLFSYQARSDFLLLTAAFGMAMLLWSSVLGFIYKPRVAIQRDTPKTAIAYQPLVSQIGITNESRRGLFNFTVRELVVPYGRWPKEWLRPHLLSLPAGQHTTVTVSFEPQKRGKLTLSGLAVQSYFPFFLTRFTVRCLVPKEVYVLPETLPVTIPSLRHIAEQASKRLTMGTDNARKGPSLEYAYSRQYATGDALRRLDHRASSRRGEPMSKVFEGADEIRRDKVHLIVDLTLQEFQRWQRRPRDEEPLDERLSLAVEIGLSAQNEGFSLAALATGKEWHTLDNLLDFYQHIATCQPQRAVTSNGHSLPTQVLSEDGLHILVVGRWSDETQAFVERWKSAGVLVLVFMMPESDEDIGTLPTSDGFIEIQLKDQLTKPGAAEVKQ
ncbi:MAG: DUF58 domain-containing protein [Proteobacteria bacterium]|nr:DUF58 domain-containing protein [Pseudomonadota bacterium]